MKLTLPLCISMFSLLPVTGLLAGAVTVGNSSLIGTVQASDTFTFGSGSAGVRNGQPYTAGTYPLSTDAAKLESDNSKTWGTIGFSINNDANFYGGANPFPGGSGAGSATGMTQTGINQEQLSFGVAYGQSQNYFVQADAAIPSNTSFLIYTGGSVLPGNVSNSLTIYFNPLGSIDIGATGIGRVATGLSSLLAATWNNYAVNFDLTLNSVSIYTNESLVGTINLNSFSAGAYAGVLDLSSNSFVGMGDQNPDNTGLKVFWTDNFQVGLAAVPEPSMGAMLLGGLALLGLIQARRTRRTHV